MGMLDFLKKKGNNPGNALPEAPAFGGQDNFFPPPPGAGMPDMSRPDMTLPGPQGLPIEQPQMFGATNPQDMPIPDFSGGQQLPPVPNLNTSPTQMPGMPTMNQPITPPSQMPGLPPMNQPIGPPAQMPGMPPMNPPNMPQMNTPNLTPPPNLSIQNLPDLPTRTPPPLGSIPEPPAPPAADTMLTPPVKTNPEEQVTLMTDDIEQIVDSIVDEKFEKVLSQINKLDKWKTAIDSKITDVNKNVEHLEKRLDQTQKAIMSKVTEYHKSIGNVNTEIKALTKVWEKVMPTFTSNVKELSNVVSKTKSKTKKS